MAAVTAANGSKVIQVNLNHCAAAQDLLVANIAQWGVGLAIVAEPYYLPHNAVSSKCGLATIIVGKESPNRHFARVTSGDGWVAAEWGELTVVSCYYSPKWDRPAFERFLGGLGSFICQCSSPRIMVLGDFNAKSKAWGCPGDDVRGRILRTWAERVGLRILNRGNDPTCVRKQGTSIVDVSFATPAIADVVSEWGVMDEETLSDHRYIRLVVSLSDDSARHRDRPEGSSPRWALRRLDRDALMAAVAAVTWSDDQDGPCRDVEAEAAWFRDTMSCVSDVAMPRAGRAPPRRSVYWWGPEIDKLRAQCNTTRRRYTDSRRAQAGRSDTAETTALGEVYRASRGDLTKAIEGAKAEAWAELLDTLDKDPWGRPYLMVRKKLRTWTPPITEFLEPRFLEGVVDVLFPKNSGGDASPPDHSDIEWSEELGVSEEELGHVVRRMGLRDTAPGPDGLHGRVWVLAHSALGDRLRRLFDACLSRGEFPPQWREARMVLLRKDGRPVDQPSAYRPICLLDDVGKLFERVIVNRLVEHLSRTGPDLADCQFGFREGRSTVDAINRVRSLAEEVVSRGGVMLAISLDIANAFNTLPWERIREALIYHQVPPYIRRIIGAYLRDRWISYPGKGGKMVRRRVYCGVPQGSVLGPLLWNLGYDAVLRAALPPGVSVVCYADDTLLLARGADWNRAHARAEVGARHVVSRIRAMGLRVDLGKTEALWFHAPRRRPPLTQVLVGEANIRIGTQMKYLGLFLDSTWCFRGHFDRLVPRIKGVSLALGRILPNIGGPEHAARRLYVGVVRSIALYGAPVWARDLGGSPGNRKSLLFLGRSIAQRVARTYRTAPVMVAHVLAGVPPFDLLAEMYRDTYHSAKQIRQGARPGTSRIMDKAVERMKHQAWRSLLVKWQRQLADHDKYEIVRAIRPHFEKWLDGCRSLTYRMAQVLTGHGCFGGYLFRIRRESAAVCRECNAAPDTPAHVLEECPSFSDQRRVLRAALGWDLSLSAIVAAIVESEEKWQSFSDFCDNVMSRKEEKERERERMGDPTHAPRRPRRRRRGPAPESATSSSSSSDDDGGGGGGAAAPLRRAPTRGGGAGAPTDGGAGGPAR